MANFLEFTLLAAVMGFSIYLSLPLVLHPRAQGRFGVLLSALALGILIFLLADIFGDVAGLIAAPGALYLTVPEYDAAFLVPVVLVFLALMAFENPGARGKQEPTPAVTALIIALAMGFQNLTEGLVFGSAWSAGEVGLVGVIFTGFVLQNITEGFPIAVPFLGSTERPPLDRLLVLFFVGGAPTIAGALVGYVFNNTLLDLIFDGAAIGAILYVILPMMKAAFRSTAKPTTGIARIQVVYLGILAGFVLGFLVNAV
jgi:ZIP family zinc transporter